MSRAEFSLPTILPLPVAVVWDLLSQTSTLKRIGEGFVSYHGDFPERWQVSAPFDIKPKFHKLPWSLLPQGSHMVKVHHVDQKHGIIETLEAGGAIRFWNHVMKVEPTSDPRFCEYTDTIVFNAGLATPVVLALVAQMYEHRHKNWQKLALEMQAVA